MKKNLLKTLYFCLIFLNVYSYELSIGVLFRNEANYLKEWIEYHKLVGVEHFLMYNNGSEDNWEEVLEPYIQSGLVEVFDRSEQILDNDYPVKLQLSVFRDALTRSIGTSTWIALIDVDEFLLPMTNSTVTDCLNKYFKNASGVLVNWRMFGTSQVTVPPGNPILSQLKKCSFKSHSTNTTVKSIVRPEAVLDPFYPHYFTLKAGYSYYNGDNQLVQFEGLQPVFDGKSHDKYIRINHYYLRDENFYQNYRLPRTYRQKGDLDLLAEHYNSFLLTTDTKILDFIKKYHPEEYRNFWKHFE